MCTKIYRDNRDSVVVVKHNYQVKIDKSFEKCMIIFNQ